jgi:hypothetical protein
MGHEIISFFYFCLSGHTHFRQQFPAITNNNVQTNVCIFYGIEFATKSEIEIARATSRASLYFS